MADVIDRIIETINQQKGELLAHNCLVIGLLRGMPLDHRADALREFDTECDVARNVLLNSSVPDVVLKSFEENVSAINELRFRRPASDGNKIA